jgi:hypothetical protein
MILRGDFLPRLQGRNATACQDQKTRLPFEITET